MAAGIELWDPGGYWLVRFAFKRGLALIYLLAFLVAATQFRPLCGAEGLMPLSDYVDRRSFRERPSLFYLVPDDRVIGAVAWGGVALSAVALVGAPGWLPRPWAVPASVLVWGLLWLGYLSFVNAGQLFYGYGWESMLLETGFLAVFLGAGDVAAPAVVVWLLRWVLFRNMFGAGLIKLRGDDCWRELTCMDYHYETQPMPNPLSWYAHHLPDRFHRWEVVGNHVVELVVPFMFFAPQPFAAVAGVATIAFQAWLMLTGNFSWLNALTVVLAVATFSDGVLSAVLPVAAPATAAAVPLPLVAVVLVVALVVVSLSVRPVRNMLSPRQKMNAGFDPLHLVNTYGAFGSITRHRYQVVIEGTRASDPGPDDWEAYRCKGQPVALDERPRQWAPYHLRLDWQLWFAAMSPGPHRSPWFVALLERLLDGDDATESLFADTPFDDDRPPETVRAVRYRYRFTSPAERRETGNWWARDRVGTYVRPVSKGDFGE